MDVIVPRNTQGLYGLTLGYDNKLQLRWLMIPKSEVTTVSFNATWVKNWEPFYIARRNVPMFDERFKQYGFGTAVIQY